MLVMTGGSSRSTWFGTSSVVPDGMAWPRVTRAIKVIKTDLVAYILAEGFGSVLQVGFGLVSFTCSSEDTEL